MFPGAWALSDWPEGQENLTHVNIVQF